MDLWVRDNYPNSPERLVHLSYSWSLFAAHNTAAASVTVFHALRAGALALYDDSTFTATTMLVLIICPYPLAFLASRVSERAKRFVQDIAEPFKKYYAMLVVSLLFLLVVVELVQRAFADDACSLNPWSWVYCLGLPPPSQSASAVVHSLSVAIQASAQACRQPSHYYIEMDSTKWVTTYVPVALLPQRSDDFPALEYHH